MLHLGSAAKSEELIQGKNIQCRIEYDDIYKGAVNLAEQTDCFIIWPECIPTAKKIRNGEYGTVYIYPQTDSI